MRRAVPSWLAVFFFVVMVSWGAFVSRAVWLKDVGVQVGTHEAEAAATGAKRRTQGVHLSMGTKDLLPSGGQEAENQAGVRVSDDVAMSDVEERLEEKREEDAEKGRRRRGEGRPKERARSGTSRSSTKMGSRQRETGHTREKRHKEAAEQERRKRGRRRRRSRPAGRKWRRARRSTGSSAGRC